MTAAAADRVDERLIAVAEAARVVSTSSAQSTLCRPNRRYSRRYFRPNIILGKIITVALAFLVYGGFKLVIFDTSRYIQVVRGQSKLAWAYRAHFVFWLVYLITSFGLVYFGNNRSRDTHAPPQVVNRTVVRRLSDRLVRHAEAH